MSPPANRLRASPCEYAPHALVFALSFSLLATSWSGPSFTSSSSSLRCRLPILTGGTLPRQGSANIISPSDTCQGLPHSKQNPRLNVTPSVYPPGPPASTTLPSSWASTPPGPLAQLPLECPVSAFCTTQVLPPWCLVNLSTMAHCPPQSTVCL